MKLTNNLLTKIIQEEMQKILQEQETKESLVKKIDKMANYLGITSDYSSLQLGEEVINAALKFINQNSADNVFDTSLEYLKPDEIGDWEDEVLGDEENFNDPDMYGRSSVTQFGLEREDHPHFIFALYAGYYS